MIVKRLHATERGNDIGILTTHQTLPLLKQRVCTQKCVRLTKNFNFLHLQGHVNEWLRTCTDSLNRIQCLHAQVITNWSSAGLAEARGSRKAWIHTIAAKWLELSRWED